ncbi:MAG: hypothetical protein GEV12_02000 [Micromonosporaceae bacterium]|nr:hypothetical protein [Micromonosporaceae bacterium]
MDQVIAAQQRLARAKRALGAARQGEGWEAARAAHTELLDAERQLARARGEQYAQPIDLGVSWDAGSPLPHVISDSHRTIVIFYRPDPDPNWDGRYVNVVDAGQPGPAALGLVEFTGAYLTSFGGLNDEAMGGHPLYGRGLDFYCAHVVPDSTWITAAERANSVHPSHRGGWHQRYHHYVLCFHDETLECMAEDWRAEELSCSMAEALALAAARLASTPPRRDSTI